MADLGNWVTAQVDVLSNIANTLQPVNRMISGAAFIIGLSFIFKALYTLKVYGEARTMMSSNSSIKEPLIYFLVAAVFIYLPSGIEALMDTTFGYTNILQYAPVNGNGALGGLFGSGSSAGRPLALLIQTIGLIAFIRGWVMIARSASQGQPPGGTGKGIMHVFGGILAMNIVGTLQVINSTLYGT